MLIFLIILGSSLWLLFDAKTIGIKKTDEKSFTNMSPVGWFFCSLLLWIVTFPLYLIKRAELKSKFQTQPPVEPSDLSKLINCPDCNKEISRKAISCPNCVVVLLIMH